MKELEKLNFKVRSKGGAEIEIVKEIPKSLRRFAPDVFDNRISRADCGDFFYNVFRGKGFMIWFSIYLAYRDVEVEAWGDVPVFELHIPMEDPYVSRFEGVKPYSLRNNQYDLTYLPHVNNVTKFVAGMKSRTFDVHYLTSYLRAFEHICPALGKFLDSVEGAKEPLSLLRTPQFLSSEMVRLINSMVGFNLRDEFAADFFDSTMHLFTTYFVERLAGIDSLAPKSFSATIIDRTIAARELITKDLNIRYTIAELARKVLLSSCSLQDCFKHLYGDTIFDYSQAARMQRAGDLLILKKDLTIQDVSEMVGYKNNSNFTNAFKIVFGCTPDYHRKHGKLSRPDWQIADFKPKHQ